MKIAKLARVIGLGTLVGALSLGGVFYASEYDSIEEAILNLRLKAESWQKQAGLNKAELNEMTDKYNTLEANYKAILGILKIEDGADIEEVKAKVQEIYDNAINSGGVEGANNMLEAIADALGITLTDADKNENGVYKTDRILEELSMLEDELDKLEEAIGDLSVNLEAGDMEYSDDMSLTEKINYLIGQINLANDEQDTIKKLAEDTLAEVEEASADYVYVAPPVEGEGEGDQQDLICDTCNQETLNSDGECTNLECATNEKSEDLNANEQALVNDIKAYLLNNSDYVSVQVSKLEQNYANSMTAYVTLTKSDGTQSSTANGESRIVTTFNISAYMEDYDLTKINNALK